MNAQSAVLVQDYPAAGLDDSKICYQNDAAAFAQAAREQGLPAAICATLPENMDIATREFLIEQGVAPMQGLHETLNALRDAANWSRARARLTAQAPAPLLPGAQRGDVGMLTEDAGKQWLAANGVRVPEGRTVSGADLTKAASAIGYPVALKMMSPLLAHKTEAGAVALNLRDAKAVTTAAAQMTDDVRVHDPKALTDSFLVEAMSPPPLAELIVTLRGDPQFGASLVLGSGGILVELVGDVVTLLLPTTPEDIAQALTGLRAARLLGGFRGRPMADISAIAAQIHTLCCAYQQDRAQIAEIEINPMFVYTDHICAIDALLHRAQP
jgi:acyl-CoA synthetase (NDP forming)